MNQQESLLVNHTLTPERFHEVVRIYSGYVYTIAFRLLGNSADAEDAAQETFIKAYKRLHTYDEGRGIKNWLCTIALNTARDFYRRSNRRPAEALGEEHSNITADPDFSSNVGDRLDAGKMLSILAINYRSVMVLYYMEQLSVAEIAAILKKSESVVKVWLFRARKILMEKFGDSVV